MSQEGVRSQLQRTDDEIKNATGKRPTLFRPPYGSITERQKRWIHDEFGYDIILWDVDPLDWKRPGPAVVRNRILKETRPGSIVLSHDIHPGTIEAMPSTFDELEAKGFKFVTVSELLGMATPVTPHPKAEPAEKTAAKAAPSAVPASSPATRSSPTVSCNANPPASDLWPVQCADCLIEMDGPQGRGLQRTESERLLLRGAATACSYSLLALPTRDNEMIVIAVASPRTRRHIADFYELPVGHVSRRQPQIIANRGGHIQAGPMVKIRLRTLVPEDVLKMVCAKRAAILPLRVADAIALANSDPAITAYGLSLARVRLLEPRDHERRFRLELPMRHIVIRECEVEWILPRDKGYWDVIPACARLRVVRPTVIRRPIIIPATFVVRHRIISARFLTHPEDRRYDVHFPRVTLDRRAGTGRDKHLRFHLDHRLLPELHRVLGKIRRRRVGRTRLLVPEDFRGASNRQTETGRKKSPITNAVILYPIPRF